MSKSIPDLIKTGESTTVEFKEKFDERCIESLVAFANTRGGVIFIGVSDKTCFKGYGRNGLIRISSKSVLLGQVQPTS